MKMNIMALAIFFVLSAQSPIHAQGRKPGGISLGDFSGQLQELTSRVSSSVVQITGSGYGMVSDGDHAGTGILTRERSTGSGVIVSEDGYIMTNAHVVDGARTIRIRINGVSGKGISTFDAVLTGIDRLLDLALLKIETTGLQALPFGNANEVKQGELVMAFGSPLGMDNSVSMGIVSAAARQLTDDDPRIYIQTDAPINPGNSGGPLVNTEGHLIGINTFIFSKSGGSEGIGFAVPSNVIRYVFESLRKDGHVHRAQIGIAARTITPSFASGLNLEPENGVLVEDTQMDGPAEKAGIEVGDVVLSIGDTPLRNVRDLALELYRYNIGETVSLQILRADMKFSITLAVAESDDDPERFADMVNLEDNLIPKLGILGLTIDDKIRSELSALRIPDGVLVAALGGSPSYFGDQPQAGDVIHAVNGTRVNSIESLEFELRQLKPGKSLVLQLERNGTMLFLALEPN
jgi:serine protease Do